MRGRRHGVFILLIKPYGSMQAGDLLILNRAWLRLGSSVAVPSARDVSEAQSAPTCNRLRRSKHQIAVSQNVSSHATRRSLSRASSIIEVALCKFAHIAQYALWSKIKLIIITATLHLLYVKDDPGYAAWFVPRGYPMQQPAAVPSAR